MLRIVWVGWMPCDLFDFVSCLYGFAADCVWLVVTHLFVWCFWLVLVYGSIVCLLGSFLVDFGFATLCSLVF